MKRIRIICTGGTIACRQTEHGLKPLLRGEELLALLGELPKEVKPEICQLFNIDSTDMKPEYWLKIKDEIKECYDSYDGFVICHGTDTMAYTSAALSYLIQDADKPIVLTGSQLPIGSEGTDAVRNLTDSILYAADDRAEGVVVVFGGRVIEGTRAKKIRSKSFTAFESINFPETATIRDKTIIWNERTGKKKQRGHSGVRFYDSLSDRVYILKLTPGMKDDMLPYIFERYDCIIVESFGLGGMMSPLMDSFCELARAYRDRGIHKLIVIATQVLYEGTDISVYETGRRLKERIDVTEAGDMCIEAVYAKAMWLLGQGRYDF